MKKKMMLWLGAALMAVALVGACGGKSKTPETTPPSNTGTMGGDAYGAPMGGDAYGNPCGEGGNPCGGNPCGM
jgi:hypothetical protein